MFLTATTSLGLLTPRVGGAVEYNGTVLVLLGAEDIVELNGKAVQVTDVQRAKVMVESVVEKDVVNGEVVGRRAFGIERGSFGRSSGSFSR